MFLQHRRRRGTASSTSTRGPRGPSAVASGQEHAQAVVLHGQARAVPVGVPAVVDLGETASMPAARMRAKMALPARRRWPRASAVIQTQLRVRRAGAGASWARTRGPAAAPSSPAPIPFSRPRRFMVSECTPPRDVDARSARAVNTVGHPHEQEGGALGPSPYPATACPSTEVWWPRSSSRLSSISPCSATIS